MTLFSQYRYVRHAEIEAYAADGWTLVDDFSDCHHGHHAVLMGRND